MIDGNPRGVLRAWTQRTGFLPGEAVDPGPPPSFPDADYWMTEEGEIVLTEEGDYVVWEEV